MKSHEPVFGKVKFVSDQTETKGHVTLLALPTCTIPRVVNQSVTHGRYINYIKYHYEVLICCGKWC